MEELSFLGLIVTFCLGLGFFIFLRRRPQVSQSLVPSKSNETHNPVEYTIITKNSFLQDLINSIKADCIDVIGLDVEYHRGEKYFGEISLFQISLPNKSTYIIDVIQIEKDEKTLSLLKELLENTNIMKVMHSCDSDVEWIYDQLNIQTLNIFDTLEAEHFVENNKSSLGLGDLLGKYNLCKMDRGYKKSLQKSNWSNRPLSQEQLNYAALDSYFLIPLKQLYESKMMSRVGEFRTIMENKIKDKYSMSLSQRLELKANNYFVSNMVKMNPFIYEISKAVFQTLYQLNDSTAKMKDVNPANLMKIKLIYKIAIKLPEDAFNLRELFVQEKVKFTDEHLHILQVIDKIKTEKVNSLTEEELKKIDPQSSTSMSNTKQRRNIDAIIKHFACKGPAYENHMMLDPAGNLICYCDSKKMNWYIDRGLAKQVSKDPPTFQLNFEPGGKDNLGDRGHNQFFRTNCCIVCGKEENYLRFNVVPSLYKQFFPDQLRSRAAVDIILLCFFCMEKANKNYDIRKKQIATEYDVPLVVHENPLKDVKILQKIVLYAKSIDKGEKIPENRKIELKTEILEFLNNKDNQDNFSKFFVNIFPKKDEEDDQEFDIPCNISGITEEHIKKMSKFNPNECFNKEQRNLHGKLICERIKDFKEFINGWRDFFLETMKPKDVHKNWEGDYFYLNFMNKCEKTLRKKAIVMKEAGKI